MVLAADDHGVHRGHAVFDTLAIIEGRIYQVDAHLARFFRSAALAGLMLPFSRAQVKRVLLETAAAARAMDGSVRVWLGAGRGGYGLSARECRRPSLHVAVYTPAPGSDARLLTDEGDPDGMALWTARGVGPPDAWAAGIKSTNYLRNALAQAEAEGKGFDLGVFCDPDTGLITEAVNASVGIITREGELVIPPWDRALPGVTAQRVADLLPSVSSDGIESGVAPAQRLPILSTVRQGESGTLCTARLSFSFFFSVLLRGMMSQPQTDPILNHHLSHELSGLQTPAPDSDRLQMT